MDHSQPHTSSQEQLTVHRQDTNEKILEHRAETEASPWTKETETDHITREKEWLH